MNPGGRRSRAPGSCKSLISDGGQSFIRYARFKLLKSRQGGDQNYPSRGWDHNLSVSSDTNDPKVKDISLWSSMKEWFWSCQGRYCSTRYYNSEADWKRPGAISDRHSSTSLHLTKLKASIHLCISEIREPSGTSPRESRYFGDSAWLSSNQNASIHHK